MAPFGHRNPLRLRRGGPSPSPHEKGDDGFGRVRPGRRSYGHSHPWLSFPQFSIDALVKMLSKIGIHVDVNVSAA